MKGKCLKTLWQKLKISLKTRKIWKIYADRAVWFHGKDHFAPLSFSNCATRRRSHNDAELEKSWQVWNYASIKNSSTAHHVSKKGENIGNFPNFTNITIMRLCTTFESWQSCTWYHFLLCSGNQFSILQNMFNTYPEGKKYFSARLPNGNSSCSVARRSVH